MANPLANVETWLYHLGDVSLTEAVKIGATKADLVVIDYAVGGTQVHTPRELSLMRGHDFKLIVSYLSIGEAEDYRSYWKSSWNSTPPNFLSASNPEWPDNFKVKYWDPAWQAIIFKYVDDIVKAGFNGVYLDIIDAYQYWQSINPVPGMNYAQEMAKFVGAIRAHAKADLAALHDTRPFVVIGQNGEELIANPTYRAAIDGLAKEDLSFYYQNGNESGFAPVPSNWLSGSKPYLELAEKSGIQVFVVEYMTTARVSQYSTQLKAEIAYLNAHGIPIYISQDRDLTTIFAQPTGVGLPVYGTYLPDHMIGSLGADIIGGRGGNDLLEGLSGNDSMSGGPGNDTLVGGLGVDMMRGGAGNDRYVVDNVFDTVSEINSSGVDRVLSSVSFSLSSTARARGEIEHLALTGIAPISATGNAFANVITGNAAANVLAGLAGNDVVNGGPGRDVIAGGSGNDTLIGGPGDDVFVFNTPLDSLTNRDVITDFSNLSTNNDTLYLDNAVFTKLAAVGALNPGFFWNGAAAHDANDYIVYNRATGVLSYDANGSAAGGIVQFAVLTNKPLLGASDFMVI